MKIIKEDELKKFISYDKMKIFVNVNFEDTQLNELLSYYSFLRDNSDLIQWDKPSIYYSMYYWYVQLKERYFELYGFDAGMEQQGFKLLEDIDIELEEGIDWTLIEKIESRTI